jgi:hypothetical protein
MIETKSEDCKEAPPIKPPSMSDCENNSLEFVGLQEPPYSMEVLLLISVPNLFDIKERIKNVFPELALSLQFYLYL